jgi:hypothetical protein
MRLNAVIALAAALALAGCETLETLPARTGSLRPAVSARGATSGAGEREAALPDAILACLNRGVQSMTPEFRNCVTHAQRAHASASGRPQDRIRTEAENRR